MEIKIITQSICVALAIVLLCPFVSAQWLPTNGPINGVALSLAFGTSVTHDTTLYAGTWNGLVFKSTNRGESWIEIDGGTWWMIPRDSGFTTSDIRALVTWPNQTGGSTLLAGTFGGGVFLSQTADTQWRAINNGLTELRVFCLLVYPNKTGGINMLVGTAGGIFLSADTGASWQARNAGLTNTTISSLAISDTNLFAGTNSGVFRSTDNGTTWESVLTAPIIRDLLVSKLGRVHPMVYAGDDGNSIHVSSDDGLTWETLNEIDPYSSLIITALTAHDTILYAGTIRYFGTYVYPGMYFSLDGGVNWVDGNRGLGRPINEFLVCGDFLYVATASDYNGLNSVWKRPLLEMVTGVERQQQEHPSHFALEQNYPNPFNPNSNIRYQIAEFRHVRLAVYDLLGREVDVLVNERKAPGIYEVKFDGSNLASGVYFYRLQAGDFVSSKRMLILK
jgi:hypothetical protein